MDWSWLAPVLSLIGALAGGLLAAWFTSQQEEKRIVREQVREARSVLERCAASRIAPDAIDYPGMETALMAEIRADRQKVFFNRYFDLNFEAKAALGAIRHLDDQLLQLMQQHDSWRLEEAEIAIIRVALTRIDSAHS